MKIVVISQRVDAYPDRNEWRDALDQKLSRFLIDAGYIPVPVPNFPGKNSDRENQDHVEISSWFEAVNFEAVILSGGNDIGTCQERDLLETALLNHAQKRKLPVLGICRGMQMMGVWAGASLKSVQDHVRTRHHLSGEITREVNSFHNQSLSTCPPQFEVLGRSEDGEIEAVGHRELPWEGWMWHPEREDTFDPEDIKRTQNLFG